MKNNNSESKVTFPAFIGATIPKDAVVSKKTFFDLSVEYDKIRSSLRDAIGEMKQAVIDRYAEFKIGDRVVITFPDESEQKSAVCFISHVIVCIPARETKVDKVIDMESEPFIEYKLNKCKKDGTESKMSDWRSEYGRKSIRLYDPEKDAHLLNQK